MRYLEFAIDQAALQSAIAKVLSYSWVYDWGMYFFLFLGLIEVAWIFIDSTQKRKAQRALAPRILALIGFILTIPPFIFRYTGNADGVYLKVRLLAEPGQPFYNGPINWNVKWLIGGYGPAIALIAMVGVVLATLSVIIYASTVSRSRPSTEFIGQLNNQFGQLRQEIQSVKGRQAVSPSAPTVAPAATAPTVPQPPRSAATIIDRPSQARAATIIDRPGAARVRIVSGGAANRAWQLPQSDVSIGRDTTNFISIEDGKSSREHARIRYADGLYSVADLGSSNGTYLNDRPLGGQTPLKDGDLIRIGDTVLAFSAGS